MTTTTESNNNVDEKKQLEKVFELIQKGNDNEDQKLLWDAVNNFCEAWDILQSLCNNNNNTNDSKSKTTTSKSKSTLTTKSNNTIVSAQQQAEDEHDDNEDVVNDERQKIKILYKQQADMYFHRARTCFINALVEEDKTDQKQQQQQQDTSLETLSNVHAMTLSDEQCIERVALFGKLFAKELVDLPIQQYIKDRSVPIDEQQSTLEGRLRELNQSLPPTLKSDDERMRAINKGLNRLGLSSMFTDNDKPKPFGGIFQIQPPKSESDEIADIISQARDEVAVLGSMTTTTTTTEAGESTGGAKPTAGLRKKLTKLSMPLDDSDDEDESDIDKELDEDDDDVELTPEICREMQDKIAEAQTALAELIAMFEVDRDGDAAICFDQGSGKNALKRARVHLLQVTRTWNDSQ